MHHFRSRFALPLACAVLAMASGPGLAQEQTTATYDDWTVRCTTQPGPPPKIFCAMDQLAQLKGQDKPFSRVAIARPAKGEPVNLVIQVPTNVWLPSGVKIEIGGKETALSGSFNRCTPAGCFAPIALKDAVIVQFRTLVAPVRILYSNAAQQQVAIPLSFKGFAQAFDALQKQ